MNITYFLFGAAVCRAYDEDGLNEALKVGKREGFGIYRFNPNEAPYDSPVALISEYDGWEAWAVISEMEYLHFLKLRTK